ncbi:hypothetical protein L1887_14346 [Cichorium endivia]|nr:hypothetical protein L1887_14346 [Cichorium endivia]
MTKSKARRPIDTNINDINNQDTEIVPIEEINIQKNDDGENIRLTRMKKRKQIEISHEINLEDEVHEREKKKKKAKQDVVPKKKNVEKKKERERGNKKKFQIVSNLSPLQKATVVQMGFKSFLELKVDKIPLKLSQYVLSQYDCEDHSIIVKDSRIRITKEKIHRMFAVKLARKIPVISMWTTDDLENREMEEIISDGFGLGKVVEDGEEPSTRFNTIEEQTTSIEVYF